MASSSSPGEPLTDKKMLTDYLSQGVKARDAWRIGTEHEKFAYRLSDCTPLAYDTKPGIRQILEGLKRFGWDSILEGSNIIALKKSDGSSVTLEPGGQFELSGAPVRTIHNTCDEVHAHLAEVKEICQEIGAGMIGIGFIPQWRRDDIHWMPKGRYKIMREYMPKKGTLGHDMMLRTSTVQVNLDFDSESDMVQKMRIAVALQPVATALFANSPFTEGKPNGFLSYRSHTWTDTDPDRSGMLPFVFDDDFGFERWADYVLDVPMYFVYRGGGYLDVSGRSFRDFMDGKLEGFEGQYPSLQDWENHITTPFPEVRLKHFIEMRGADGGPWSRLCALPALWVGLLYDSVAQDAAWELIKDWTVDEMQALRDNVPRMALKTPFRDGTLQDIAKQTVTIAYDGLKRRAVPGGKSADETQFLETLREIADSGISPAERLLESFEKEWDGDIRKVYEETAY
ncbi:glutamate--cysteine ligase [Alphaproteobacteria bacterium]|jgi:glutamate--cysteine ligase|nr:glutamate--cysteine ligase [Alphaproteobacteria bacterium]